MQRKPSLLKDHYFDNSWN